MNTLRMARRGWLRAAALALCACLMWALTPSAALADAPGGLTVCSDRDGATYRLYRVTEGADGELTDDFSDVPGLILPGDADDAGTWQNAAALLAQHAEATAAEPLASETVGEGAARFTSLDAGLYLVLGDPWVENGVTMSPIPILVRVSDAMVAVHAKAEAETPEEPGETPTTEKPAASAESGDLPRTWDVIYLVAAVGAAGAALVLLGARGRLAQGRER